MALVSNVAHFGIAVRDLDGALAFYHDALGLPLIKTENLTSLGIKVALLRLGDAAVELMEPLPGSALERFVERRGEGLHHVALGTDDIGAALAQLKEKGGALADEEPRRGLSGLVAFLRPSALHGVLVELEQPER
jgi:methylmalonyl-CoA/ethylmalonyl-CoA epimerase